MTRGETLTEEADGDGDERFEIDGDAPAAAERVSASRAD
jgi:hypothetical protein